MLLTSLIRSFQSTFGKVVFPSDIVTFAAVGTSNETTADHAGATLSIPGASPGGRNRRREGGGGVIGCINLKLTSVTTNSSPSQDYIHPDDQTDRDI